MTMQTNDKIGRLLYVTRPI